MNVSPILVYRLTSCLRCAKMAMFCSPRRFHNALTCAIVSIFAAAITPSAFGQPATGGVIAQSGSTFTHIFTSSGTFQVPSGVLYVRCLVVGGGGGGGANAGGGGGAGGVQSGSYNLWSGSYTVTVGSGGGSGSYYSMTDGYDGGSSSFYVVSASGGQGGRSGDGSTGGDGGGGSSGGTDDYGNPLGGLGGGSGSSDSLFGEYLHSDGLIMFAGGGGGGDGTPSGQGGIEEPGQPGGGGAGGAAYEGGQDGSAGSGGGGGGLYQDGGGGGGGFVIIQYTLPGSNTVSYTFGPTGLIYTGSALCPQVTSTVPTASYTVSFSGTGSTVYGPSSAAPSVEGTYSMTVNATGNYVGTGTVAFTISDLPYGAGSGGQVFRSGNVFTHVFTSSGAFAAPPSGLQGAQVLIVGGGGGGGNAPYVGGGGGGGAGGVVYLRSLWVGAGNFPITVGAGGTGGVAGASSVAFGVTALGGGYGGSSDAPYAGGNGGSGGGGGPAAYGYSQGGLGSSPQGTDGASGGTSGSNHVGGGGGGASIPGTPFNSGSMGGDGQFFMLGGQTAYVGGGGGGGGAPANCGIGGFGGGGNQGQSAAPSSGGGGGGGTQTAAGSGGSGLVIITYTASLPQVSVSVLSGDNQGAAATQFNASPFDVAVWNVTKNQPIAGVSLRFTVSSGGGLLATTNVGTPPLSSTLTCVTDVDGTARAYYQQPSAAGVTSHIVASFSNLQAVMTSTSAAFPPNTPSFIKAVASTPTTISFSWSAVTQSAGGLPVQGYNVYRNGALMNSSPLIGTSFSDTTAAGGNSYSYAVRTVDTSNTVSSPIAFNVSAPASSTSGTFDVLTPTL